MFVVAYEENMFDEFVMPQRFKSAMFTFVNLLLVNESEVFTELFRLRRIN